MIAETDWSAVSDAAHRDWVDSGRNEKLEELEAEMIRLRAEVEKYRKDAARYRWLQKQTPYRFGKIQAACVIDAVDTLYFKADEFDAQIDAAMGEGK